LKLDTINDARNEEFCVVWIKRADIFQPPQLRLQLANATRLVVGMSPAPSTMDFFVVDEPSGDLAGICNHGRNQNDLCIAGQG